MRTSCLPIVAILTWTLVSCSDSSKADKEVIKEMEKSLEKSIGRLKNDKLQQLRSLQEDRHNPISTEKASIWFQIADSIIRLSQETHFYIDSLKKIEKISNENIDLLIAKLKEVENKMFLSDKKIEAEFSGRALFQTDSINNSLHRKLLINSSKDLQHAYLINLQNRFNLLETDIVTFCGEQYTWHIPYYDYDVYSIWIGQNAQILKPGGQLEIQAGIGGFSRSVSPKIKIANKLAPLTDGGFSHFKMNVLKKEGLYKIPVEIKFYNKNIDEEEIRVATVEYTVAKECDQ